MLCVTINIARVGKSSRCQSESSSVRRFSAVRTSSAENGSSMNSASGSTTSARANPDALAHATGELFRVGGFETVEADEVDRPFGAVAPFCGRNVVRLEAELDVLAHGQPRQQRERLEHHREPRVRGDDGRVAVQRATTRWRDQAGKATQQRRLARAGLAQERDDLAVAQLEADVVEHAQRRAVGCRERLGDVIGGEDRRALGLCLGHSEYLVSASR